jgi:hypothetical protein
MRYAFQINVRHQAGTGANVHLRTNDAKGADFRASVHDGARINYGRRMDRHRV